MTASAFHPGQRWISVSEPELGLGEIRSVGSRTVTLWFPATRESRQYVATSHAPIRRAAFRPGDTVTSAMHGDAVVRAVREESGLLYYVVDGRELCETDLSHTLSFSSPMTRLFAGQFDSSHVFELRLWALEHLFRQRQSEVRGFVGGRIDLLPHQLGIAAEVTGRLLPRVLLADEVGLGKTIEASLIVHRLLLTGRAQRVLIVVPETLVHQWFLELLRRFNLWFHIFNEARCVAIEDADPGANPFLDDQLLLCELRLFIDNDVRVEQAVAAGWDVVVVDEAHHLEWTPGAASAGYAAIERMGGAAPGLLLLTATPEQLGIEGHFARLRLLDPDRFCDLEQFAREARDYRKVAQLAGRLRESATLSADEAKGLAEIVGESVETITEGLASSDAAARDAWIESLLDRHGTGRVMFRNTRATVPGFPARVVRLHPLAVTGSARYKALSDEWFSDLHTSLQGSDPGVRPRGLTPSQPSQVSFGHDPRISWLAELLLSLGQQKVLLICRTQHKATAIAAAMRLRTTIPMATFHEGHTLIQRDRAAASFADPDGARLLICSEIGSEGRNFQFAHHLVLFDLPLDPAVLEQRIGRLDRIGQHDEIQVHVPFIEGSHLELLARWYHEGLNAFQQHIPGGRELLERFEPSLRDLAARMGRNRETVGPAVDQFIASVRQASRDVALRMEQGRDRLLEWNSSKPALSGRVVDNIRRQDEDRTLDEFMLSAFDVFFIDVEEVAPRTYRLGSAGVLVDDFPGLKADGLTVTRDRARALSREDLQFLTWDHPLATGALDLLLGSEKGNCAFARWPDADVSVLYLDVVYVLECLAPGPMHVDRFLPPTPLRVVIDHRGRDVGAAILPQTFDRQVAMSGNALLTREDIRDTLLPRLVDGARRIAESRVHAVVERARADMRGRLEHETARLRDLQKVNRTVRDGEIAALVEQQRSLDELLGGARLRLDAVRLIHRGPQR